MSYREKRWGRGRSRSEKGGKEVERRRSGTQVEGGRSGAENRGKLVERLRSRAQEEAARKKGREGEGRSRKRARAGFAGVGR